MLDFIVLGLIPGTNISIGFYVYIVLVMLGLGMLLRSRMTHKLHKHHTQKKIDKINRLAL